MSKTISCVTVALLALVSSAEAIGQIATFDELPLTPESYYNGAEHADTFGQAFQSAGASFDNYFSNESGFDYWERWSYSNTTDRKTEGYTNQYSTYPGVGSRGSANYAVGYDAGISPVITLPAGYQPVSVRLTNTTYTALAMRDGYYNAKQFGGATGDDPDWLRLTITGRDAAHNPIAELTPIQFYLADFRFADNSQDYILDQWTNVNLSSLAGARELAFTIWTSDTSPFGGVEYANTPTYVALDDLSLTQIAGDVNGDGNVDIADLTSVADQWLQAGPVADATGDGKVDIADIALIATNWQMSAGGGVMLVPEPSTYALAICSLAFIPWTLRRARRAK